MISPKKVVKIRTEKQIAKPCEIENVCMAPQLTKNALMISFDNDKPKDKKEAVLCDECKQRKKNHRNIKPIICELELPLDDIEIVFD